MLGEIHLDQFGEGEAARNPPLATDSVEFALERVDRVLLAGVAAALDPPRITAARSIAIGSLRLAVAATPLEHEHLPLLQHLPVLLDR